MAFSPRKQQINQHLANRQRNKKSEQTSPAQTWPARWRVWEGGMGLPHRCEFLGRGLRQREEDGSLEAEKNKQKQKQKPALPGASSGKIKVGCELPDPVFSVHFLQFHPAVLKPDFNLSVREVDAAADL